MTENKITTTKTMDGYTIIGIKLNGKKRITTPKDLYLDLKKAIREEYGQDKAFEFEDTYPQFKGDAEKTLRAIGL